MAPRLLEITDLLWPVDADGVPVPVCKADVLDRLRGLGQRRAARIVAAFPAADGILDPGYVDALGFRVHCELQRLGEELQLARRVAALLYPIVDRVRLGGAGPVRVVDVGCGLGFVVRAMAACSALGPDVEPPRRSPCQASRASTPVDPARNPACSPPGPATEPDAPRAAAGKNRSG
jgi:hypothetical protein